MLCLRPAMLYFVLLLPNVSSGSGGLPGRPGGNGASLTVGHTRKSKQLSPSILYASRVLGQTGRIGAGKERTEEQTEEHEKIEPELPANASLIDKTLDHLNQSRATLLRHARWLSEQHSAWLLIASTAIVAHSRANREKQRGLQELNLDSISNYHIAIVTTAALPWMTGTAVNPLLRAAHLARAGKRVTLSIPWLHPVEQEMIFPNGLSFDTPAEQEVYIREWLRTRAGLRSSTGPGAFQIRFYPSRYDVARGSILPLGDITRWFSEDECDVCVLEEPEHLTWYHSGPNWRHRFKLVVGIVHTNYLYYAETWAGGGKTAAAIVQQVNHWMCSAYCDKVVKLSDTLQPLPRASVCNVHGVRSDFIEAGRRGASPFFRFKRGAYFLGKALWAKGYRLLFDYLQAGDVEGIHIDLFGQGEELQEIRAEAASLGIEGRHVTFHGPTDHGSQRIREYKVFVNPSQSEVLSTTTAEALAMGKFVVIQRHPSNNFFSNFTNALEYDTPDEFRAQLKYALAHEPQPLSAAERRRLSWEGATDRFISVLTNLTLEETIPSFSDHTTRWVHQGIQKGGPFGDTMRALSGAGPIAKQSTWMDEVKDADVPEVVEKSLEFNTPHEMPHYKKETYFAQRAAAKLAVAAATTS